MSKYLGYRDGGKTNEEGLYRFIAKLFKTGVPGLDSASTTMAVSQRAAGANMSVDIAIGDVLIPYSTYLFTGFTDAIENVSVDAADPSNGRKDIVVAYVDLSVVDDTISNNPDALKFKVVAGTPSGSPAFPDNTAIQASVGGSNPWVELGGITLLAADTSVTNGKITDRRKPVSLMARLWGGASNTIGHLVPNVADDTIALLAAAQTLLNKTLTAPILNNPTISGFNGWQNLGYTPNSIVALGNRSYQLTFNSVDLTGILSAGMRNQFARTVASPNKSSSFNGTNQYWSKSSPAGMAFTDDFVAGAWIKISDYGSSDMSIMSRYDGTSGWDLQINTNGQLVLLGFSGSSANFSRVISSLSVPIGRWIHVTAQLDMSSFPTNSATTSYIMFDGVNIPATVGRGGTNPTTLVQAGDYQIGARNGAQFFNGKIAQARLYSAKVTQATILASINRTLSGSETSLVSAYSFSNSFNDLNTGNANNLTANGSIAATTADSPFGNNGASTTLEYGIVQSVAFSTNTTVVVQLPVGCELPTTGGISSVNYSTHKTPFGFPASKSQWTVQVDWLSSPGTQASPLANTWYNVGGLKITVPAGHWVLGYKSENYLDLVGGGDRTLASTLSTSSSTPQGEFQFPHNPRQRIANLGSNIFFEQQLIQEEEITVAAATDYFHLLASVNGSSATTLIPQSGRIKAINGYL